MPRIDDELDAAHSQYPERVSNPVLDATCAAISAASPALALANALRRHFSARAAEERVRALLDALESTVRRHGRELAEFQAGLEHTGFLEAWTVAAGQAIRTAAMQKIRRFAAILGTQLVLSEGDEQGWQDAATFIRDVAELSDADIEALRILDSVQGDVFSSKPDLSYSFECGRRAGALMTAVDEAKLDREDFFARCLRLSGFGLALMLAHDEEDRVTVNGKPVTYGEGPPEPLEMQFRMTARGYRFISMLRHTDDLREDRG